jgi:tetratricopeptide (TPR) repeat protein
MRFSEMTKHLVFAALAILLAALISLPAWGQATAQVTGKILDKGGAPLAGALVVFTNMASGRTYKLRTDKNGEFSQAGVTFGDYQIEVFGPDGQSLYREKKSVAEDPDSRHLLVDLSKSQSSAQPKLTPEQIEAIKAQRAKAISENAIITQVNAAMQSKDWAQVETLLKQLLGLDAAKWEFYQGLGTAQLNLGHYEDAVQSFEKGVLLAQNVTDAQQDPAKLKAGVAKMLTNEGNAYLKSHKTNEAVALCTRAAAMDPNPAIAYFNLCAMQYNTGNVEGALDACEKAIAADPNKADAYFIKGSLLIAESKQDKDGKVQATPGTVEALNKYLELAPDGAHASDVKQMLEYIGAKVETTSQKRKK